MKFLLIFLFCVAFNHQLLASSTEEKIARLEKVVAIQQAELTTLKTELNYFKKNLGRTLSATPDDTITGSGTKAIPGTTLKLEPGKYIVSYRFLVLFNRIATSKGLFRATLGLRPKGGGAFLPQSVSKIAINSSAEPYISDGRGKVTMLTNSFTININTLTEYEVAFDVPFNVTNLSLTAYSQFDNHLYGVQATWIGYPEL